MKLTICSIYDKATEAYMRPFTAQTRGQATRMFEDLVNTQGHEISNHPEDYALFHVANFSDNSGEMEAIEPVCLARAHELIRRPTLVDENQQTIELPVKETN